MKISALGKRDKALGQGPKSLSLRLGRGDALVREERSRKVREKQALVGRTAAEAGALRGLRHGVCSFVSVSGEEQSAQSALAHLVVVAVEGGAVKAGNSVFQRKTHLDELVFHLVDRLLAEVTDVHQLRL